MAISCMTLMPVFAQSAAIEGVLKEKLSGLSVEYASISLNDATTNKLVSGTVTDSLGLFRIDKVSPGKYYLKASYVGCKTVKTPTLTITSGKNVNIGTLLMDADSEMLGEVTVSGRKTTFVGKLDRKVFNVGQDLMSSTGSASDLMQNIPSVEVDMDGTVSLRGNENVTILINGRPSSMMSTKTRGDALNQLSATDIERVEVISNPSAQFKPDGVSGIINIILKKSTKRGVNGTATAGLGSAGRYNIGTNLNYGLRGVNLWGGYTFRRDRYDRTILDQRYIPTSIVNQNTYGIGRPVSHTFRLGMNTNLTKNDFLELSGNYNNRRFQRNERIESETQDVNEELTDFYLRDRDALAKENMWEGSLRYTHTYGKDNEWGINYTYSSESEDEVNDYSTSRMSNLQSSKDRERVWDANYLHIANLNWIHHLGESFKLSSGYEIEALCAEQNFHLADWDGTVYQPNIESSSDFTHLRTIQSLYSTLEYSKGNWSAMLGLRGEYAWLENKLISQNEQSKQHYYNLYPTLHISRKLDAHNELQFNYSLRVNRPEGNDMNPFAERINPLSLQAGNPDLMPEKIHSVEMGWMWQSEGGASLMSTVYYRYLTNKITEVTRYLDGDVLLTTKENLNSSQNAGVEMIWNCPLTRWFNFNWNANGFYNQIDASKLGYGKNKGALAWSTLLNANFTPLPHYMIQVNARFRSSSLVPQGKRDADSRINIGMRYDFPKTGLSLSASVTDLFDTYKKSYSLDTPELKQKVEKRRNPRIFSLGLTWQIGNYKTKKHDTKLEYDESM